MLDRGVIEPCQSSWASPVVLVMKKDGTTCFCVDYHKLNDVTKKDTYPLPRVDDTLDALHGSMCYTLAPSTSTPAAGRLKWTRGTSTRQPL